MQNPEEKVEPHNHRFAGISSEAIFVEGGHIHGILTNVVAVSI
ncbi:MAG: YmaF family protein [Dethiobacteria bacterium]